MPFKESPMDETFSPPTYPKPDWEGSAVARRVWDPSENATVGYLILQDEQAFTFLTKVAPDQNGYTLRKILEESIRLSLQNRMTAQEALEAALELCLADTAEDVELPKLLETWVNE